MFFTAEFPAHYAPDAFTRFVARLTHYVMWPIHPSIIHLMHIISSHLSSVSVSRSRAADPLSQAQVGHMHHGAPRSFTRLCIHRSAAQLRVFGSCAASTSEFKSHCQTRKNTEPLRYER